MPDNMWFACLPPSLAVTRTALEQSGARGGSYPAPLFGTCALPLLERRGARTCRGLGVMHGPSEGGPAQWAAAQARAAKEQTGSLVAGASSLHKPGLHPYLQPLLTAQESPALPGAFSAAGRACGRWETAERRGCPKGASLL